MSFPVLVLLGIAAVVFVWAILLAACLVPEPEEVEDDGFEDDETLIVVVSPWQFMSDVNGDWVFTEAFDDGSFRSVRVTFTSPGAQGVVTEWVQDALVAKTDAFLREQRG